MIRAAATSIAPVFRLIALQYYRAALSNLQRNAPCHPDLPHVVRRINELEAK